MLLQIMEPGETPQRPQEEKGAAIGIDLGTTNSVVAIAEDGKTRVLPDADGKALIPSVVYYAESGDVLVGSKARAFLENEPERVVSSIKRLMGRGPEDVQALAGVLPFSLSDSAKGGMVRLLVSGKSYTPVEISADILKAAKAQAEAALGRPVSRAVVTTPAYFDDAARLATKDAARLAGLDVLRLVNEPTAAALAYGLDHGAEGLYAVYDLGGGTFDFSLLHMEKGVFQVRATGGNAALGGDDFDHVIAELFLSERAQNLGAENLESGAIKQVLALARQVKEDLTTDENGHWDLTLDGKTSHHSLSRAMFNKMIAPLVDRTLTICRGVLSDAEVEALDIQGVVLVGGSTRTPLVQEKVASFFGKIPLVDIDPDQVVALGAALQAEALTVGSDMLLLDVTPLSLGLETMGSIVEKIIPRNTPIPVAMAQEFTTYQDGQTAMLIHALQGERELADQNRSLARFVLSGIPPMAAGAARIRVTFTVDADGILTVSAEEETTGCKQEVMVKPSYGLTDEEMASMLRDSMINAKDDMTLRLLIEARVEAKRSLLAVEAALAVDGDLLTAEERQEIDTCLAAVYASLPSENREEVQETADHLEEATKEFAARRMDRGIQKALAGMDMDRLEQNINGSASA